MLDVFQATFIPITKPFLVSAILLGCFTIKTSAKNAEEVAVSDLGTIRQLFTNHQLRWLPVSPPTHNLFIQEYELAVPVIWKQLPQEFLRNMTGELTEDFIPIYPVVVWEDPTTYETVFTSNGRDIYRLPPVEGYDPYAWQKSIWDIGSKGAFTPDPIYAQTHIGTRMTLIPSEFYDSYILLQEQRRRESAALSAVAVAQSFSMFPMAASSEFTATFEATGSIETDSISMAPAETTEQYEIYYTASLISPRWVVAQTGLWGLANGTARWTGARVGEGLNLQKAFYRTGDTDDFDGDGLSSSFEKLVLGTDPLLSDSDNPVDGTCDGDEDFDGDGLSNADEYLGTTLGTPSSPLHADSDSDGICDGTAYPPPNNLMCRPVNPLSYSWSHRLA